MMKICDFVGIDYDNNISPEYLPVPLDVVEKFLRKNNYRYDLKSQMSFVREFCILLFLNYSKSFFKSFSFQIVWLPSFIVRQAQELLTR